MSQQTCRLLTQLAFLRLAPALHFSVLPRHSHELLKKDFTAFCIIAAGMRGCKSFFMVLLDRFEASERGRFVLPVIFHRMSFLTRQPPVSSSETEINGTCLTC